MNDWWEAFWFFLPAGMANMAPIFANQIPGLNGWRTPLDFGRTNKGQRILGDNKTWRGLVFGTLAAAMAGWFQYRFLANSPESTGFIIITVAAMGFGALAGDALESMLKRRRGIAAGDTWLPFDQIDYIIGGLVFVYPFIQPSPAQILRIFIIYFGLHLITSYLGYLVGLKQKPI